MGVYEEREKAIRMFTKSAFIIPDSPISRAALRRIEDINNYKIQDKRGK